MQTAKPPEIPLRLLMLAWARFKLSQIMASLRPRYSTASMAALVAGSGNPAGF